MKIDLSSYVPKREEMLIPEWGDGPFYVQELSGGQLEMLQNHVVTVRGQSVLKHQFALLIIASMVDKDGEYLFTEKDIPGLEKQPATLIARLAEAVDRVSGIVVSAL